MPFPRIVQVVAARYKLAMSIGEPAEILPKMEAVLSEYAKLEQDLPRARGYQRVYLARDPHKEPTPLEEEAEHYWSRAKYDFILAPKGMFRRFKLVAADDLFLALLQKYQLPAALRKKVEAAARFYAKTRVLDPSQEKCLDAFEQALATHRGFVEVAKQAVQQGTSHGEASQTKVQAGSFTVVNTGGFPPEVMQEVVEVVKKAEHRMRQIGLGQVCYGDVLISNTVHKSKWAAFYLYDKDEMFIRSNLKGKQTDTVKTICHELAHRFDYRFMKGKQKEKEHLYLRLLNQDSASEEEELTRILEDPKFKPIDGEEITVKGVTLVVQGVQYSSGYRVRLKVKDEPHLASMPLLDFAKVKGYVSPPGKFVSHYARTDAEENFAEMVANYAMGTLSEDRVAALKPLLD